MSRSKYLVLEQTPFDVVRVSKMLRKADVLCAPVGIRREGFDPYHLPSYRVQEDLHKTKARILLDLNVVRRIASLHPGCLPAVVIGEQERIAAALMAFGVYANALLDPGLAVREWFPPEEDEKLEVQTRRFLELDDVEPELFADVALGFRDRIPPDRVRRRAPIVVPPLPARPDDWDFDYTALLKVAILALTSEKEKTAAAAAMEEFLNWSWRDFLFSSPAIQFGALYLSPRRKKNMLKKLRSGSVQDALEGVRNATWDLAYLRLWAIRTLAMRETKQFHFFCSLDQALRESARDFLVLRDGIKPGAQERLWKRLWGERDGRRLVAVYKDLESRQNDPMRAWKAGATIERAEDLKRALEDELGALVGRTNA